MLYPSSPVDPTGDAHGCASFSDRAMDGESENSRVSSVEVLALSRKAAFFWLLFFAALAKKSDSDAEGVRKLCSWKSQSQRPWMPAFAGMTGIGVPAFAGMTDGSGCAVSRQLPTPTPA